MAKATADTTWNEAFLEAECYNFLNRAAAQAVDKAMELVPEAAPFVGDEARKDLQDICRLRLSTIYERAILQLGISRAGFAGFISLNIEDGARAQAMRSIAQDVSEEIAFDDGASLCASLPLAANYERIIADNFTNAIAELFARLFHNRDEISQTLLGGRPITCITGFSSRDADPHCHGRMVMRITTDAGQLYYKPHDCQLDALYLELASRWFSDSICAARLVSGNGYAFVEQLVPQELSDKDDLCTYWYNFGCLTALFHGLGSRDMTQDNIMCCGLRPAVLDLETFLSGQVVFSIAPPTANAALRDIPVDALADSALCAAVLPICRDDDTISPLVANASGTCLPHLHGRPRTVQGYDRDFIEGFRNGYHHLMRHQEELLATLQHYKDATCRQILLNTKAYSKTRSLLLSPQALAGVHKCNDALEQLNAQYDVFPAELRRAVARPDAAALSEGDIPYYCSRVDSRKLCANGEHAMGELLTQSALEVATHRLRRLSEEDLRFEVDLVRRCFAAYVS